MPGGASAARSAARLAMSASTSPPPPRRPRPRRGGDRDGGAQLLPARDRLPRPPRPRSSCGAVASVHGAEVDPLPRSRLGGDHGRRPGPPAPRALPRGSRSGRAPPRVPRRHNRAMSSVATTASCSRRSGPRTTASARPLSLGQDPAGDAFSSRASRRTAATCSTSQPGRGWSRPSSCGAGFA